MATYTGSNIMQHGSERREFDPWNRDEVYEAVVMSEKGSIVGCKGAGLLVVVENAANCGGERPSQRSQWKD